MKVPVKRAFKSYIFVTKKTMKKQTGFHEILFNPNTSAQMYLYPIFQNQRPIFCCLPFLKNISTSDQNQQNGKWI